MNAKVLIGSVSFEISGASASELIEFARLSTQSKPKDVVSVTREAIAPKRATKRPQHYIPWSATDISLMAKIALDLGPDAKIPASLIAKEMQSRPGNKRTYNTLYGMAYNIARFLKEGKPGNLSKSNLADLAENGYTASMMVAAPSNLLGDVRHLSVHEA